MPFRFAGAVLGVAILHLVIMIAEEKYVPVAFVGVLIVNVALWKMGSWATGEKVSWRVIAVLVIALPLFLMVEAVTSVTILKIVPCAVHVCLLAVFSITLLPNQVPLITQVRYNRGGRGAEIADGYTRHLTVLWTFVFFLLALESLWLIFQSEIVIWSWWINFINPAVIVMLFLGEHALRPRRFGRTGPLETLQAMAVTRFRIEYLKFAK